MHVHENLLHVQRVLAWPVHVAPFLPYGEAVIVGETNRRRAPLGAPAPAIIVDPVTAMQLELPQLDAWQAIDELVRRRVEARAAAALRRLDDAVNSYDWLDHTDIDELLEDDPA